MKIKNQIFTDKFFYHFIKIASAIVLTILGRVPTDKWYIYALTYVVIFFMWDLSVKLKINVKINELLLNLRKK